jgi:hypothetical protein
MVESGIVALVRDLKCLELVLEAVCHGFERPVGASERVLPELMHNVVPPAPPAAVRGGMADVRANQAFFFQPAQGPFLDFATNCGPVGATPKP